MCERLSLERERERSGAGMVYPSRGMLDREEEEELYDDKMVPLATEQQPHVRLKARIRELRMFQVAALVLFIAAIVFLVLFVQQTGSSSSTKTDDELTMYATCVLVGGGGVSGVVTMWQAKTTEDITVEVTVSGLKPGEHGFHIHELYVLMHALSHAFNAFTVYTRARARERET